MEWYGSVSTIVGAGIGITSTLAVDRVRWKRQRFHGIVEARRNLYSDYLADLSATRDAVRAVARRFFPSSITRHQAVDAFRSANLYSRRYQISITAPEPVINAATETFRSLRRFRDVVAAGHDNNSAEYKTEKAHYEAGLAGLIRAMRGDLDPVTGQGANGRLLGSSS